MVIVPYIHFEGGTCEAAMTRYAEVFGGEIEGLMRWSDGPPEMQAPPGCEDWVMHSTLRIGDQRLFASDSPPPHGEKQQGVSISLTMHDEAEARAAFEALAEGGEVFMPFQKTFWAEGFGHVRDRFGTNWMLSAEAAA